MPMDKPTADSRSVQSFAIIKTLDTRIFSLALFKLELEMDYPSETNLCTVAVSSMETAISVINECRPRPWAFACLLLLFAKDYF